MCPSSFKELNTNLIHLKNKIALSLLWLWLDSFYGKSWYMCAVGIQATSFGFRLAPFIDAGTHTAFYICVINKKNRSAVHNWVKIVRASDWWRPFLYPSQPMGAGRSWCRRLYIWYVTQKQKDNILLCIWVKQPVTIFPTGIPTWFLFGLLKPI